MSVRFTNLIEFPILVFGLVGPIGVDLEYAQETISDELKSYNYATHLIHITDIMEELHSEVNIDRTNLFTSYNTKIDYANDLRKSYDANEVLAAIAISDISKKQGEYAKSLEAGDAVKQGQAFVVRQLKTPDEVRLFRSVYGRQFVQVSLHGSPTKREEFLITKLKIRSKGTLTESVAKKQAEELIERDRKEDVAYGQNISSAFPLGDVFINSSDKITSSTSIERFLKALFGNNEVSPTRQEYGMYVAKSASLRSSDLSRQVGAAIFAATGEVISLGSNEVPKSGGGTYWTGDPDDSRDMREGHDPNELTKVEIFADIINRLNIDEMLSDGLLELKDTQKIVEKLLDSKSGLKYRSSRVMDLIEFGRIIHAEMSAICDAARNGTSIKDGVLYCTTFPCHLCAKHIVASGISAVIYLEPYPKSYAERLHSDSIEVDGSQKGNKVAFLPFIGISPHRYRDLFEKGKRKNDMGEAKKWFSHPRRPMIDVVSPAHIGAEENVIAELGRLIVSINKKKEDGSKSEDVDKIPDDSGPILIDVTV
ncbi:anti-phage dCTP deaminase [Methylobacterium sp. WL6]|uniref:anti-phage dCTP deaminase n=1 Tax=Methylobacterium sp. WL6 TaxID=2603901 RepID=UPI0011CB0652|nr:anti-phage dCTP deaminase [Methylobacterium sp. WL6]TXN61408.1 deoxycytidylate deaminase [Methylobacterium sp. WL6]